MSLPAAVQLGFLGVVFVVAFVVGRRVETPDGVVSVPVWFRTLLTGPALGGPWLLHSQGLVAVELVDGTIVTLTLSLALYRGAPALVGTGGGSRGTC